MDSAAAAVTDAANSDQKNSVPADDGLIENTARLEAKVEEPAARSPPSGFVAAVKYEEGIRAATGVILMS